MNFVSAEFLLFLTTTWVLFMVLPPKLRAPLLLAASYFFYATWSIPFVAVILFTTSIDYFASKIIHDHSSPTRRKTVFLAAIAINLMILSVFKYGNFLLDVNHTVCHWLNIKQNVPAHMDIILPLGISYYTFEAISYLFDTYRGSKPAKSWLEYNFYIMYFPHLISGPIIRFSEMWNQYRDGIQTPEPHRMEKGIELLILGYLYKVVIANGSAAIADPIFSNPAHASTLMSYLGALAFTTQVYFDFMGYTHIARGASLLFNIELPLNFSHPFNSNNISNFWERWQISLTRWIRDYVFIPLGGTRVAFVRILFNLFIVMFICGVWHGSGYRYVVWGAYYGLLVVAYYLYKHARKRILGEREQILLNNKVYHVASIALTYMSVMFACVIFRTPQVGDSMVFLSKMTHVDTLWRELLRQLAAGEFAVAAIMCTLLACCFVGPLAEKIYYRLTAQLSYFFKVQMVTAAAAACWLLAGSGVQTFIYFEF